VDYASLTHEELIRLLSARDEALNAAQQERETLVGQLGDLQRLANIGFWSWDVHANVVLWSDQVYVIYGIAPGTQVDYELVVSRVHPADREYHDQQTERWMKEGASEPYRYRIVVDDGSVRHVQGYGEVDRDESGNAVRFRGAVQDVTRVALLQEQLEQALLKTIRGFLPICAYCKAIQADGGDWKRIETFISQHADDAQFSHGVCPSCERRAMRDLGVE